MPRWEVLTVKQAAHILQFSEAHVCKLLAANEIPGAMKLGGTWRISSHVFYQFLDGRWHKAWPAQEKESAGDLASGADRTSR